MKNLEEKYGDRLLDLLAENLPESEALSLHAEMGRQPELRALFNQYARLDSAMQTLGQTRRENVPGIDIVDAVMGALPLRSDDTADDLMAHIDGSLDDLATARLRKRLDSDPRLQEEVEALRAVHDSFLAVGHDLQRQVPAIDIVSDVMSRVSNSRRQETSEDEDFSVLETALEGLGKHVRAASPEVDLRGDVMRAVANSRRLDQKVSLLNQRVQARQRAKMQARNWMIGAAAAALVLVMLSVWLIAPGGPNSRVPVNNQLAAMQQQSHNLREQLKARREEQPASTLAPSGGWRKSPRADAATTTDAPMSEDVEASPVVRAPLTLREAQELRREAVLNELKREEFARVASLTPDEALAVLKQRPITPSAVMGATQFLTAEDAVSVLEEAIAQNPDNAYLRAALASRHNELEQREAQLADLDSWSELDPENGLPLFQKADALFAAGDYAGAMDALLAAEGRPYASPYPLETARYHQAALEANGMDAGVAAYFAAGVAGSEEYGQLTALQQRLLAQGEALEQAGDLEAAADVYDSVRGLGDQVTNAATLPNVMQAGYETQLASVDLLAGIPEVLTPETLNVLTSVVDTLWRGLTDAIDWSLSVSDALNTTDSQSLERVIIDLLTGNSV